MGSIVGFTLTQGLPPAEVELALAAQRRVVSAFDDVHSLSLAVGGSRLDLWGRGDLSDRVQRLADGSVLALVGSPHGRVSWRDVTFTQLPAGRSQDFELPWDGRVILLGVGVDGQQWVLWTDWVGSIPVFHGRRGAGRIASTLEPVVIAATRPSADDIFLPGLVSLLINGHFLADWTLFEHIRVVPADSVTEWTGDSVRSRCLWTVKPSKDRYETAWDELVDEMSALSQRAITDTLKTAPSWVLPLSGGLDSRLIATVGADLGVDLHAYAWGPARSVDVVHSRDVARALHIPWTHIDLGTAYLQRYTQRWAAWFGSSLHFHGMYQMAFLDAIAREPPGPVVSGFLGDVLTSASLHLHTDPDACQIYDEWYRHWTADEVRTLLRVPLDGVLERVGAEIGAQLGSLPGTTFQKAALFELWTRQHLFTSFHPTLADYWRGAADPFLNRAYARFCLSLPRAALDGQRLLGDVYRRHHTRLATIPGTYADEPLIRTGRYLSKRRLAALLPAALRRGPLRGFRTVPPRMDIECVQANGWKALWPLEETRSRLPAWLDVSQVDEAYRAVMASKKDMRPLRKLQSVQALALQLLDR